MKILLLSMPNAIKAFDLAAKFPNLGLCSLAGNLRNQHQVLIADLVLCRGNLRNCITNLLKDYSPHVFGLSCYCFQYATTVKIAKIVKQVDQSIRTVLGGYHPTLLYDQIPEADTPYIDFIIRNEGEFAFRDLIEALDNGEDFSQIEGLTFKREGQFHHNRPGNRLNLLEVSLPDRTSRIFKGYRAWGLPCDVVESSRGCTFDCTFCTVAKMYGRSFRRFPLQRVLEDIRNASELGAKTIFFVDDNITLDMHHLEELCDAIIAEKLNDIHYITQASVDGLSSSRKIVSKMAKAGFKTVFLGIESDSDKTLEFFGKNNQVNVEKTKRAVAYLKENKLIVLGAIIVGNPDDKKNDMWRSFHYMKELKIDGPLFLNPAPLPQTKLRDDLLRQGLVENPSDFTWYMGSKANARTRYLSIQEINRIVIKMYKAYLDLENFRQNNVRKIYPLYFYKRVARELAAMLRNRILAAVGIYKKDPLWIAMRQTMRRRSHWLLEDVNRSCQCANCRLGRQAFRRGIGPRNGRKSSAARPSGGTGT